jgi:LuxR family quorum-sensing system transcriptional regulator CciR
MGQPDIDLGLIELTQSFVTATRSISDPADLSKLIDAVTREMGFCYYAIVHHDDLRKRHPDRVDIKQYPEAVVDRLLNGARYRTDPMARASRVSGCAFLWSEVDDLIRLDTKDAAALEFGARHGLNAGITVPYARLGECMGSCTFAGTARPERAGHFLGPAQLIGVFAFQAALRVLGCRPVLASTPRLHPRPRDCIVLAGRGFSNKEIARALALSPRTVDGYLTEARALFEVSSRAELVSAAVLAGEIGLHELRARQPG